MNDTFDIKRFGLVFKKLIFERMLQLVGSFVLLAILTWYFYQLGGNMNKGWKEMQSQSFLIGLVLGGIYWVSVGFNNFSNRAEGYNFINLPASNFEKWLSVVVLLVIFFISFCLFFRALDTTYTNYFRNHLSPNLKNYKTLYESAKVMSFWGDSRNESDYTYVLFVGYTGIMAVGSVYFNKMALVKTMFIFAGIMFLLQFLNSNLATLIFQSKIQTNLFWNSLWIRTGDLNVGLPKNINQIYFIFFSLLLPITLWLIALVRLREKEM
jgi:hypothetical protein